MKKAFLLTESSVYTDRNGEIVARGGGEMSFHILAKGLSKLGIEPLVFSIREYPEQLESEEIEGVKYERFPVKSRVSPGLLKYLKEAILKSSEFDYVFLNQFTPHLILPKLGKQKKIAVVHDVYGGIRFWAKQYGLLKGVMGYFIEKKQLRCDKDYADTILCVSEYGKKRVVEVLGSGVAGKIVVNSWPVDVGKFMRSVVKEDFALFVGRFIDYKNPEHALYALEKIRSVYPNFKLVVVASRVENKVLEDFNKLCSKFGFVDEDVVLKFDCTDVEVRDLFSRAKLFLHPSHVEGLGIVCLEALASGTPVVAYDLDAYSGMLEDGVNSRVIEAGDVDGFCMACLEVLDDYAQYHDKCLVIDKFSDERFLIGLKTLVSG